MISGSIEKEYREMVEAYGDAGGDKESLSDKGIAKLVIHENKVLSSDGLAGLHLDTTETESGVSINFVIDENTKIKKPVHLCFGVLPEEGLQEIILKLNRTYPLTFQSPKWLTASRSGFLSCAKGS